MNKLIEKLPSIVLYLLLALGVVVGVAFYAGGSVGSIEVAGDTLNVPRFTDMFTNWCYALVGLTMLATLIFIVLNFVNAFRYSVKKAIKSLIVIALFILVFVVAWFLGSPEEMKILGYEGTDNVGFWAQLTDMIIYSVYILTAATVCTIIGSTLYVKVKK